MIIKEIDGIKLKKPLKIKMKIYYVAETNGYDFFGEGVTKEKAIKCFKVNIKGTYKYFQKNKDDDTDEGREWANKYIDLFYYEGD